MWFSCVNSSALAGRLSPPCQAWMIYGLFGDSWATECTQSLTRSREGEKGLRYMGEIARARAIPHTTPESKKEKTEERICGWEGGQAEGRSDQGRKKENRGGEESEGGEKCQG